MEAQQTQHSLYNGGERKRRRRTGDEEEEDVWRSLRENHNHLYSHARLRSFSMNALTHTRLWCFKLCRRRRKRRRRRRRSPNPPSVSPPWNLKWNQVVDVFVIWVDRSVPAFISSPPSRLETSPRFLGGWPNFPGMQKELQVFISLVCTRGREGGAAEGRKKADVAFCFLYLSVSGRRLQTRPSTPTGSSLTSDFVGSHKCKQTFAEDDSAGRKQRSDDTTWF